MKKFWISILSVLLAMGLVFGAVGCGGTDTATDNQPKQEEPVVPEINEQEVLATTFKSYFSTLPEHKNLVKPSDLKELIATSPDQVLLIDIRTPEDYAKGHVKGAINVPFGKVGEKLEVIRTNAEGKQVFVTCYTGQTAGQTASLLNAAGIPVRSLLNGMGKDGYNKGWVKEGLEVVTDEAKFAKEATSAPEGEVKVVADAVMGYYKNMPEHKYLVNPDEVKALLADNAEFYLIDIRAPEDFVKGHVKGAVNIPFGKVGESLEKIKSESAGKKVFVTCYTGQTAGQTVSLLNIAGVESQSLLWGMGKDGYNHGWITEGGDVVTE